MLVLYHTPQQQQHYPWPALAQRDEPSHQLENRENTPTPGKEPPQHDSPNATYQRYLVCYLKMDPNEKLEQHHLQQLKHIPVTLGIRKMTISTNIAQQARKAERELPNTYKEFANIFSQKDTNGLPPSQAFDHGIKLEDTFTP